MQNRLLGSSGMSVSEIGYGCMGLTWAYASAMSQPDKRSGAAVLNTAADFGITLFDTADMYGPFTNEELVGDALSARRSGLTIATKCGIVVEGERSQYNLTRDGSPQHGQDSSCAHEHARRSQRPYARFELRYFG